jgi:hypothetical protein
LSVARRACVLLVVMGCVPAVQAEDPTTPATKPATTETAPAKPPAKSAPAASTPAKESATKKKPAAPAAAPEADDELLEFLGSVDGLEGLEK